MRSAAGGNGWKAPTAKQRSAAGDRSNYARPKPALRPHAAEMKSLRTRMAAAAWTRGDALLALFVGLLLAGWIISRL